MHVELRVLIIYCIAINAIAYLCMIIDKYLSKTKGRRIPEKSLFLIAFLLGATGIYLGMQMPVRHKSAKTLFRWGMPLLILVNGATLYFLIRWSMN